MLKKLGFHCAIFVGRMLVLLPYKVQLKLGAFLGLITMLILRERRHIADVNLRLCFPEKTPEERKKIRINSFKSLGMAGMEGLMAWLMSDRRFNKIPFHWEGEANYRAAEALGQGIIGLSAHFDCLEVFCRQFAQRMPNGGLVYKKSRNSLFNNLVYNSRKRLVKYMVAHENVLGMVKVLRKKTILWYAPDQDFGRVRSVFVPFFHAQAATIVGTSVLARLGQANVMPIFMHRLPKGAGYHVVTLPVLDNFPSGDDTADTARINALIEAHVRLYPEQYLWVHRRFKTRPPGEPSVYT
jgi:KDO2-lipid IV(A) lauroyltransferase